MAMNRILKILIIYTLVIYPSIVFGQDGSAGQSKIDTSDYYPNDIDFNLIIATDKGYLSEVKRLIEKGANVNTSTYNGITPLMYAVQNQNKDIIGYLIDKGADIDVKPQNGITPLLAACRSGDLEIIELIIRKGADINISNKNGVTALIYAVTLDHYIMTDMLLYYGAWINKADYQGNTPLLIAAYFGYTDLVKLLLDKGASLDLADNKGYTALHCAIQMNNVEIADYLIQKGAKIDTRTDFGHTPLSYAIIDKNYALTKTLLDKGANPNQTIQRSVYPLNISQELKQDSISGLLTEYGGIKNTKPVISQMEVGFHANFSDKDAFIGGSIGVKDLRYKVGLHASYNGRTNPIAVLVKESEYYYTQYREKRSYILLGVSKDFDFYSKESFHIGVSLHSDLATTWGSYKGSVQEPPSRMLFSPMAAIRLSAGIIDVQTGYRYIDFDVYDISPHRFELGIKLQFPLLKDIYAQKKVI